MVLCVRHHIKNWNIILNSVIFKENIEMKFNFFCRGEMRRGLYYTA